jgi:hypothetical protein
VKHRNLLYAEVCLGMLITFMPEIFKPNKTLAPALAQRLPGTFIQR